VRGQGPLTLWFDGKYIDTSSTKILDLSYFRFRRKKIFPHFFNITSMGEKLISKINKNKGMILGKFQSGARPGT
jgi:hypothetical protein